MNPKGLRAIPLVEQALTDPSIPILARDIDRAWAYEGVLSNSVSGFNPLLSQIYVARESQSWKWLQAGARRDRAFNEQDLLVKEVLFLAHDHLHAWGTRVIAALAPDLEYGRAPLTPDNFEDHVFCHLLTEAIATVGLDYWYLATVDLEALLGLGTTIRTMSVSYSESDRSEIRRFAPDFTAQDPEFFGLIAEFYATGILPGFGLSDLKRSPCIAKWLRHELSYGEVQRKYTRSWLAHLANGAIAPLSEEALVAPVRCDRPWQRRLIHSLGQKLWRKVKAGESETPPALGTKRVWRRDPTLPIDFRFTNLNRLGDPLKAWARADRSAPDQFPHFFRQFVSRFRWDRFPEEALPVLRYIEKEEDAKSLVQLFRWVGGRSVSKRSAAGEPRDLFLPN